MIIAVLAQSYRVLRSRSFEISARVLQLDCTMCGDVPSKCHNSYRHVAGFFRRMVDMEGIDDVVMSVL